MSRLRSGWIAALVLVEVVNQRASAHPYVGTDPPRRLDDTRATALMEASRHHPRARTGKLRSLPGSSGEAIEEPERGAGLALGSDGVG